MSPLEIFQTLGAIAGLFALGAWGALMAFWLAKAAGQETPKQDGEPVALRRYRGSRHR